MFLAAALLLILLGFEVSFRLRSFAVVRAEQGGIQAFAVEETLQRDIRRLRAVVGHGHPHDVVYIPGPFLVEGRPRGSHRDVLVTITPVPETD